MALEVVDEQERGLGSGGELVADPAVEDEATRVRSEQHLSDPSDAPTPAGHEIHAEGVAVEAS